MLYTELTKKAIRIMFDAHKDQVDKTGLPYVFHPFHLAEQMDDENSICVALLHDVVEDTSITFEDLIESEFNEKIISTLKLLTHKDDVSYMDYIKDIKSNSITRKVKLADLKHNSDLSRLDVIDDDALERYAKYQYAIKYLIEE